MAVAITDGAVATTAAPIDDDAGPEVSAEAAADREAAAEAATPRVEAEATAVGAGPVREAVRRLPAEVTARDQRQQAAVSTVAKIAAAVVAGDHHEAAKVAVAAAPIAERSAAEAVPRVTHLALPDPAMILLLANRQQMMTMTTRIRKRPQTDTRRTSELCLCRNWSCGQWNAI